MVTHHFIIVIDERKLVMVEHSDWLEKVSHGWSWLRTINNGSSSQWPRYLSCWLCLAVYLSVFTSSLSLYIYTYVRVQTHTQIHIFKHVDFSLSIFEFFRISKFFTIPFTSRSRKTAAWKIHHLYLLDLPTAHGIWLDPSFMFDCRASFWLKKARTLLFLEIGDPQNHPLYN